MNTPETKPEEKTPADEAFDALMRIEEARDKLSERSLEDADAPKLEGLMLLQNTAALTLIALELRVLRQSFERGEIPLPHDEEESCMGCGHLASLHRVGVGDSDGGPGACRECACFEFDGAA